MPGWVAAGAAIIGDVMSQQGQKATNQQNLQNQLQMEQWQEHMSNTAMQRRVGDLKAAGLNPLLAVSQGGATVGSVSQATMQNPDQSFAGVGSQVSSAMQLQQNQAQVQLAQSQKEKTDAEASLARTNAANASVYSGPQAQASLDNLRRTNDNLFFQAQSLERDFSLSQKSLSQLMQDPSFAAKMLELKQQASEVDLTRQRLGMPRLENDAAWQKAHPDLAGWLGSGGVDSGISAAKSVGGFLR